MLTYLTMKYMASTASPCFTTVRSNCRPVSCRRLIASCRRYLVGHAENNWWLSTNDRRASNSAACQARNDLKNVEVFSLRTSYSRTSDVVRCGAINSSRNGYRFTDHERITRLHGEFRGAPWNPGKHTHPWRQRPGFNSRTPYALSSLTQVTVIRGRWNV